MPDVFGRITLDMNGILFFKSPFYSEAPRFQWNSSFYGVFNVCNRIGKRGINGFCTFSEFLTISRITHILTVILLILLFSSLRNNASTNANTVLKITNCSSIIGSLVKLSHLQFKILCFETYACVIF